MRARNARVIWDDGTLYVASRRAGRMSVQSLPTSEPVRPASPQGYWRAESDTGLVSFTSKGCGG